MEVLFQPTSLISLPPSAISTQRRCLLLIAKLILKQIVHDPSQQLNNFLPQSPHIQNLFFLIYTILLHRNKNALTLKELWSVICQSTSNWSEEKLAESSTATNLFSHLCTYGAKIRGILKYAMMQKKLGAFVQALADDEDNLRKVYLGGAFILCEEGAILADLLKQVNFIDFNYCLKDDDLDNEVPIIDLSLYIKCNTPAIDDRTIPDTSYFEGDKSMGWLREQKHYLEEVNSHLKFLNENSIKQIDALSKEVELLKMRTKKLDDNNAELNKLNRCLIDLIGVQTLSMQQDSMFTCKNESKDSLNDAITWPLTSEKEAIDRDDNGNTADGVDKAIVTSSSVNPQLSDPKYVQELTYTMKIQREFKSVLARNKELESEVGSLKSRIFEKNASTEVLRKQLQDVKCMNVELYDKYTISEMSLRHKNELVEKLEENLREHAKKINQMNAERMSAKKEMSERVQAVKQAEKREKDVNSELLNLKSRFSSLQAEMLAFRKQYESIVQENSLLCETRKNNEFLHQRNCELKRICQEQEKALIELSSQLKNTYLENDSIKESMLMAGGGQENAAAVFSDFCWQSDKDCVECFQCKNAFSLSKRKHHCRKCGRIFCNLCSSKSSFIKVLGRHARVCDNCYNSTISTDSVNSA